jgi:hypoxanthine phosphoribosyltransferase
MSEVKIHDKTFQLYLKRESIEARIGELARELNTRFQTEVPIFLPVLKGGVRFWAALCPQLTFPYELDFIKLSGYGQNVVRERVPKFDLVHTLPTQGRPVVIVEDIVDNGLTADAVMKTLVVERPSSTFFATLLYKPDAHTGHVKPDWIGFSIENKFVVGFGMDYNERGRELSDIYQIVS